MQKINFNDFPKKLISKVVNFWNKLHIYVFFILLIAAVIFGLNIWRQSLYGYTWSDEKKIEFFNSQDKAVVFKEGDFREVLDDIASRKWRELKEHNDIKNIFLPYN